MRCINTSTKLHIFIWLSIHCSTHIITSIELWIQSTIFIIETNRSSILHLVGSTSNRQRMTCNKACRSHFVKPIGIGSRLDSFQFRRREQGTVIYILSFSLGCTTIFTSQSHILLTIHHIRLIPIVLKANRTAVAYLRSTVSTFFGCNDNNTIGCTRTVNGSRGSILQNINFFNIIRINVF